jgi:hypothetical protein
MCRCLETIRKRLEEHHKSPIDLDLKMTIVIDSLELGRPALPPMYYTYMVGKRRKKSYVHFNFCPFCGTRYVTKKPSESAPGPDNLVEA